MRGCVDANRGQSATCPRQGLAGPWWAPAGATAVVWLGVQELAEEGPGVGRVVPLVAAGGVAGQGVHVGGVAEHVSIQEHRAPRVAEARPAARLGVVVVDLEDDDLVLDVLQ